MLNACIIQARLGSSRLPAKILLPLPSGRTVLEQVIAQCIEIRGIDTVVVAVPNEPGSDILAAHVDPRIASVFRGDEFDVLSRYAGAAERTQASIILRVTSDCPMLNVSQCEAVLDRVRVGGHDFASNSGKGSFALGWSCEAFTIDLLREANEKATDGYDREHVGPYMRRNARNRADIVVPIGMRAPPSLDTLNDYKAIWNLFEDQMREAACS